MGLDKCTGSINRDRSKNDSRNYRAKSRNHEDSLDIHQGCDVPLRTLFLRAPDVHRRILHCDAVSKTGGLFALNPRIEWPDDVVFEAPNQTVVH